MQFASIAALSERPKNDDRAGLDGSSGATSAGVCPLARRGYYARLTCRAAARLPVDYELGKVRPSK
jgi:hypothetical protein